MRRAPCGPDERGGLIFRAACSQGVTGDQPGALGRQGERGIGRALRAAVVLVGGAGWGPERGLESGANLVCGGFHTTRARVRGGTPLGALDICIAPPPLEALGALPAEFHPGQHVAHRPWQAPGGQSVRWGRSRQAKHVRTPPGAAFSSVRPMRAHRHEVVHHACALRQHIDAQQPGCRSSVGWTFTHRTAAPDERNAPAKARGLRARRRYRAARARCAPPVIATDRPEE